MKAVPPSIKICCILSVEIATAPRKRKPISAIQWKFTTRRKTNFARGGAIDATGAAYYYGVACCYIIPQSILLKIYQHKRDEVMHNLLARMTMAAQTGCDFQIRWRAFDRQDQMAQSIYLYESIYRLANGAPMTAQRLGR